MRFSPEFKHYFKQRYGEWVSGVCIFFWGLFLLQSEFLFQTVPAYTSMGELAPHYVWAWGAILTGIVKIVFLLINGSWRRSMHLRTAGSIISVSFYTVILVSYLNMAYLVPNIAFVGALIGADIFSLWHSSAEAKRSDLSGGVIRGNFSKET